jgi:hypothetical protein
MEAGIEAGEHIRGGILDAILEGDQRLFLAAGEEQPRTLICAMRDSTLASSRTWRLTMAALEASVCSVSISLRASFNRILFWNCNGLMAVVERK